MQDVVAGYTYDAEGNVLTRTDFATSAVTRHFWNAEHQLVAVVLPDGTQVSYRYDPLGRRIEVARAAEIVRYSYDRTAIDAQYDGTNSLTATYLHGLNKDAMLESVQGGQRYFYLLDALESVAAITDLTGAPVARYTYDAFGNQSNTPSFANPFTYGGREYDVNTGLYYMGLRTYDPRIGRFLSEDPLPAVNPYPYAENAPIDFNDPTGGSTAEEYADLGEEVAGSAIRYTAIDIGPLPADIAACFRGGSYTARALEEATTFYRVYGGTAGELGSWWTSVPPAGPLQAAMDLALDPAWGNAATEIAQIVVPGGTTVFEGAAAAQGALLGGGAQFFIPNVAAEWFVPWLGAL